MRAVFVMLITCSLAWGQTTVEKNYPVTVGQTIDLHFDYPEIVRISTWEKNEVMITGTVSINGGENDDAFRLESSTSVSTLYIENRIHNLKNLPQRVTVIKGDQRMIFKNKDEYRAYRQEHGTDWNVKTHGVDMDIKLEVKVPRNVQTKIESVYGMVEVVNFSGPLTVEATYGGADVAVEEKAIGELIAETNYGQIYSNLSADLKGGAERDFHTYVSAKPGNGPRFSVESKYGNVYLRKARAQ